MTLIEFVLAVIFVCLIIYIATELLAFIPTVPPMIPRLLWLAAAVMIVLLLLKLLGGADLTIPKVG